MTLTLDEVDDVGVGVAGDEAAVDAADDVALPDAGAGRCAARPHRLHVDRLVARQDQPVAGRVADHQQVPERWGGRNGSETSDSASQSVLPYRGEIGGEGNGSLAILAQCYPDV